MIENIKKVNKDKTGIKFQFSKENTYKDIVGIINVLVKCKFEQYGVDTETANSIYAVYSKPNLDDTYLSNDTVVTNYLNQKDYDFQHSNF